MIKKIHQKWFEVWGNEVAQNQILKYLLLVLGGINIVLALSLTIVALKSPPIFAVSMLESGILKSSLPSKEYLEQEAKRVVSVYLQARHNWEAGTIQDSIGAASRYVDDSFRRAFLQVNETQIKIAKEKKIAQRFYISTLKVDLNKKTALVQGERVLSVEGLRAVSSMAFNMEIRMGNRTELNPEGIYIISEQLIDNEKGSK